MNKLLKKHGKKILINSVSGALIITIIAYLILGPYNIEFTNVLKGISERGNAKEVCFTLFPIFLIIHMIIDVGKLVIKEK